jgi:hypothetical protein
MLAKIQIMGAIGTRNREYAWNPDEKIKLSATKRNGTRNVCA